MRHQEINWPSRQTSQLRQALDTLCKGKDATISSLVVTDMQNRADDMDLPKPKSRKMSEPETGSNLLSEVSEADLKGILKIV